MKAMQLLNRPGLFVAIAATFISLSAISNAAFGSEIKITLSGDMEVPPARSGANGTADITINDDLTVAGKITTSGVVGTMAHIHQGAAGKNGPVIVPLTRKDDNTWVVPDGTKLTEAQYQAFKAGELYVNVHSAEFKSGALRGQLK